MNRLAFLLALLVPVGIARAQAPLLPVPPGITVSAAEVRASLPVAASLPDLPPLRAARTRRRAQHVGDVVRAVPRRDA